MLYGGLNAYTMANGDLYTKLQYRNPKRSCIFTHDHHNHANITKNAETCGDQPEQAATMAICT